MNWFKTKKTETVTETGEDMVTPLLPLVRTMADDLSGKESPMITQKKEEKLVGFDPEAAKTSAPFYAAPGVDTAEAPSSGNRKSPFLESAESAEPQKVVMKESAPAPENLPLPPMKESEVKTKTLPTPQSSSNLNISLGNEARPLEGVIPSRLETLSGLKSAAPSKKVKLILLGVALLAVLLTIAGLSYWFIFKKETAIPGEMANTPIAPSLPIPPTAPDSPAKYQSDQPNILSFDTETVTPGEIKSALLQAGQAIAEEGLSEPIEFLIRDQKLNPLAFSRFAYLAKLEFPGSLLETLDESFSIYLYTDAGRPRTVLLVYAKNQEAFALELEKNEGLIPPAIEPLFLDMTTAPKTNLVFRDGSHLERPVRFTNVDSSMGLSVDYAVRGRQWLIGTSKNSLRAVLDKTGL